MRRHTFIPLYWMTFPFEARKKEKNGATQAHTHAHTREESFPLSRSRECAGCSAPECKRKQTIFSPLCSHMNTPAVLPTHSWTVVALSLVLSFSSETQQQNTRLCIEKKKERKKRRRILLASFLFLRDTMTHHEATLCT
ncbi:transmembrane protein, putative [Bodo saltans]|uniref:Transmembrane protein, putative n=1 Tax=Bodo saltans TaxID=75058 RepID=A0A0S4JIZ0_BODSA|nr:transmembrane protein, putative [Bodo saltans]|eukprot:CUG90130.1 transmembrane protein, putative [Bodo saltans]